MNAYERAVLESEPYYKKLERRVRAEFRKEKAERQRLQRMGFVLEPRVDSKKPDRKPHYGRCKALGCTKQAAEDSNLCAWCADRLRYEAVRLKDGTVITDEGMEREEAA